MTHSTGVKGYPDAKAAAVIARLYGVDLTPDKLYETGMDAVIDECNSCRDLLSMLQASLKDYETTVFGVTVVDVLPTVSDTCPRVQIQNLSSQMSVG